MNDYNKIIQIGVGAVVRTRFETLGDPVGTLAVVYETYRIGNNPTGISLLSAKNTDWGGYSKDDANRFLDLVGQVPLQYEFKNQLQFTKDRNWSRIFDPIFKQMEELEVNLLAAAHDEKTAQGELDVSQDLDQREEDRDFDGIRAQDLPSDGNGPGPWGK